MKRSYFIPFLVVIVIFVLVLPPCQSKKERPKETEKIEQYNEDANYVVIGETANGFEFAGFGKLLIIRKKIVDQYETQSSTTEALKKEVVSFKSQKLIKLTNGKNLIWDGGYPIFEPFSTDGIAFSDDYVIRNGDVTARGHNEKPQVYFYTDTEN